MPLKLSGLDNVRIANMVRANMPIDYQNRIPVFTQGNIRENLQTLQSYEPYWNTFIEVLLDQCCLPLYRARSWDNDLAKFKTGKIRNGSWAMEVGYHLIQAHSYDKTATDVYGLAEPSIVTNFHYQNRKDKYKISIAEDTLAAAFLEEGGLEAFVNSVLAQVQNSDNIDEYLIMRNLIKEYDETNGFYNLQVPDLAASSTPQADAQEITEKIRSLNLALKFPTRCVEYNNEHLPYVSNSTVLFASPEFIARNDVYNLAAAFNVEYARFMADYLQVIDEMPIEGAQALLADRDWFVCTDTKIKTASVYNPDGDFVNHFLHHWGIYSCSRMAPAILFSTRADSSWVINTPTYSGVTLKLEEGYTFATKGEATPLVATVTGTNDPDQAVTYKITGTGGTPVSTNTYITDDGKLWVGSDEKNSYLIVTATSTQADYSASLAIGIGEAYSGTGITSVAVTGATSCNKGATAQFTANVTVTGTESKQVVWTVVGGVADTVIDQTGKLTVSANETAANVTVMAISTVDPSKMGTKQVSVTEAE